MHNLQSAIIYINMKYGFYVFDIQDNSGIFPCLLLCHLRWSDNPSGDMRG